MHHNVARQEKVYDLGNGLGLWKVHIDALREQDRNARVMSPQKFERLSTTIGRDKRLESLPLCTPTVTPGGNSELLIISGHHRTRAARAAKVEELYVLVIEDELTPDQVRAKQLAHNAINGQDDAQVLAELYQEIEDMEARIETGLTDLELGGDGDALKAHELGVSFDFELLQIAFLPHQKREFDDLLTLIDKDATVAVADIDGFPDFKKAARKVAQTENIRNMTAILGRMVAIVREFYQGGTDASEGDNPAK